MKPERWEDKSYCGCVVEVARGESAEVMYLTGNTKCSRVGNHRPTVGLSGGNPFREARRIYIPATMDVSGTKQSLNIATINYKNHLQTDS